MSFDSIKRRREERLRQLREQMSQRTIETDDENEPSFVPHSAERSSSSYIRTEGDNWEDDPWVEKNNSSDSQGASFVIKMVISLFLLSFTYVIYNVDLPFSNQGREFIGQVMSRDFNFKGVVAEVENRLGINPSILPVFRNQTSSSQAVWSPESNKEEFFSPLKGEIVAPFVMDGKGIQIISQDQNVKAIEEGWVIFVGQKEDLGNTVIIQHENGTKSWYSGLEDVQVAEQDWVQPGQFIAHIKPGSSLYFSMQMKGQYVDPTSVITFE